MHAQSLSAPVNYQLRVCTVAFGFSLFQRMNALPPFYDPALSFHSLEVIRQPVAQGRAAPELQVAMAEAAVHPARASHRGAPFAPFPEEGSELNQCEKLVHFRDEILAGSHPRIKPPNPAAKQSTANAQASPTVNPVPGHRAGDKPAAMNGDHRYASENNRSFYTNAKKALQYMAPGLSGSGALPYAANSIVADVASRSGSRRARIEPALLEKSEDLIKAEFKLQRQRLESVLKEQLQERAAEKNLPQGPDYLSCIDVADVMAKAMVASQFRHVKPADALAANASVASDSFDDNTFYSSQHGTPDSHQVSRLLSDSQNEEMRDGSPYEPEFDPEPARETAQTIQAQPPVPSPLLAAQTSRPVQISAAAQNSVPARPDAQPLAPPRYSVPGLTSLKAVPQAHDAPPTGPRNNRQDASGPSNAIYSHTSLQSSANTNRGADGMQTSGDASRSAVNQEPLGYSRHARKLDGRLLDPAHDRRESPVVRAHNLSPVAPQPAHVSPLAVARQSLLAQDDNVRTATPAQVAALRSQRSSGSSSESSPTTTKPGENRKSKKKKRKADRLAAEAAAASPEIKAEPRSPSPLTAQPDARPAKRQRHGMTQAKGLAHDGSRYGEPITVDDGYKEGHRPTARLAPGYELREEYDPRPRMLRPASEYYHNTRRPTSIHQAEPTSPTYSSHPGPAGYQTARASSHAYLERPYRETTAFYREPRDSASHVSERRRTRSPVILARQGSMPPPRAPVARVVLNEFGEEVYEVHGRSAQIGRDSLAPVARHGELENGYGHAQPPPRAMTRERDMFEKDGIIYQRVPSTYSAPRRVFTQPEPLQQGHRSYADRESLVRPMGPTGDDYTSIRRVGEHEVSEMPREYVVRAASTRPPPEHYDAIGTYYRNPIGEHTRMQPPVRAASVRPSLESVRYQVPAGYERRILNAGHDDGGRDFPLMRSASVRPGETVRILDGPVGARSLRMGSVRPEAHMRDYAASGHRDAQRGYMPPLPPPVESRAYSVHPADGAPQVEHRRYEAQPVQQYRQSPGDGEAMYVADQQWMTY